MTNTVQKKSDSRKEPNKPDPNKKTGIVALIVTGVIALAGVWVMATAECGAELDVKIFPLPHIRFEKLACSPK
ncbi:hypothetical protein [Nostoc sp. FACHB-888]|uniref:hypothetical protein n=1 Tax=Nostoc sp. FACHB-888 TaxID=2692842 RepID=UPI0016871481|nr:hypothetical protein [Nostoc sp. FACHB-888]MBD2247056.1 hypothetical protein [Nostoc sp. FACHB-888]